MTSSGFRERKAPEASSKSATASSRRFISVPSVRSRSRTWPTVRAKMRMASSASASPTAIVSMTTPSTACTWSFTFTGAPKKDNPPSLTFFGRPCARTSERCWLSRASAAAATLDRPRARHGRNAGAGKQGDDRRVEEVEGRRQDAAERLVEEETLLEGAVERLEKGQAGKTRSGRHEAISIIAPRGGGPMRPDAHFSASRAFFTSASSRTSRTPTFG